MKYTNSPLVSYKKLSPNNSGERTHNIDRITPHCVVGQLSVEELGVIFVKPSREASSNYGIGLDGKVGMYVEEKDRSWCSASRENDQRAITIECASGRFAPYSFKDVVWNKLIDLCVDICKRYNKKKLLFLGNKEKTLAYEPKKDEMVLTAHRWFQATACPGAWMYGREKKLAEAVTKKLSGVTPQPKKIDVYYSVFDNTKKKWLPAVKNKEDYAGNFGNPIGEIKANITSGNIFYKIHSGVWSAEHKNNSAVGTQGKIIDAVMFKTDTGKKIKYRAHLKNGTFLPWVTGYNANDSKNGYAGIMGRAIDAVQIYFE